MKFGKDLRDKTLKEWRFYSVDYKEMKKAIKQGDQEDFFRLLEESEHKLTKFYQEKEKWALTYMDTLKSRAADLRAAKVETPFEASTIRLSLSDGSSLSSEDVDDSISEGSADVSGFQILSKNRSFRTQQGMLKDEYRRVGASKHFKAFIYAKKSLTTFERELDLLLEFLELNSTAFGKILKKFDKNSESSIRESKLEEINQRLPFLGGDLLRDLETQVQALIDEVNALKPELPEGWESRKVYTIGCFDLFHRGHQNVLQALREFGYFIVAGIHDDESYFKLKNKYTIDNLETRMANVKPYVDQLFVIPSTDPMLYVKSMVSQQDIDSGACCYARGDDMLQFPGRDWIESVMPVHFVPRTEACSSTLIRTIYHAEDESIRKKAAFAKTRYDGKPIDEDGNVLKLSKPVQ